jgi:hypothetical protein
VLSLFLALSPSIHPARPRILTARMNSESTGHWATLLSSTALLWSRMDRLCASMRSEREKSRDGEEGGGRLCLQWQVNVCLQKVICDCSRNILYFCSGDFSQLCAVSILHDLTLHPVPLPPHSSFLAFLQAQRVDIW